MKIPIKKFHDDETLSWEERFKALLAHHEEETRWLIGGLEELTIAGSDAVNELERMNKLMGSGPYPGRWDLPSYDRPLTRRVRHALRVALEMFKRA